MTGGVEIALADGLDGSDLSQIAEEFLAALEEYPGEPARYRSQSAYRILEMVCGHPAIRESTRQAIEQRIWPRRDESTVSVASS